MSTTFQQQAASLPIECVARRLSRATALVRQPACAQAAALRLAAYFSRYKGQRSKHSQGRKPLPLVRYRRCASTGKIPFGALRLSVVRNSEVVRYSGAENVCLGE